MITNRLIRIAGLLMILIITSGSLIAQQTLRMQNGSTATVEGTSTLHDWEMNSEEVKGEVVLEREGNRISSFDRIEVNIKAESLKSDSRRMNNNAYSALNVDRHPEIRFRGSDVREITDTHLTVNGTLTISGTSKPATIEAAYSINGGRINFKGQYDISFSEFNISAPTAMMGTIRTGDDLTVKFDVTFR